MNDKGSILNNFGELTTAVESSVTIKDALAKLGLRAAGGNYQAFRSACIRHGISIAHFSVARQAPGLKIPNEEIFVIDSKYSNRTSIKKRLVKDFGWEWKCMSATCTHPEPVWAGKPLTLQLEHINGIYNDNRVENLMFLCPNCHSQTDTFCGKSAVSICLCGASKTKNSRMCKKCASSRPRKKHIIWPSREELLKMIEAGGYVGAGKTLGVSDNAVRKHLRSAGE